jgi:hypothetical protein
MVEIHQPPNVNVIDEIWVGMSEDEDGKNGRQRLSPALQGSQSEPMASVACGGSPTEWTAARRPRSAAWIAGPCARLGSPFQRRSAGWALRQPDGWSDANGHEL